MPKARISTSTLTCLLGGLGITAVSAVCGAEAATGAAVPSGLLAWLAGVASNRVADIMGRKVDAAEPPSEEAAKSW